MKKQFLLLYILVFFSIKAQAQVFGSNNQIWTKDDRNSVYVDCLNSSVKYKSLGQEQRETLCLCFLDEFTKKYSKADLANRIDIELKRIQTAVLTQCATNLGVNLDEKTPEVIAPKETTKIEVSTSNTNSIAIKKEVLLGYWEGDNCRMRFLEEGIIIIDFNYGSRREGKWWLNDNNMLVIQYSYKNLLGAIRYEEPITYEFLQFSEDYFRYISARGGTIYKAIRIKK